MLEVQEKIVKIGGIVIPGQVVSQEFDNAAMIDDVKDKAGNVKKNQATGYDAGKMTISIKFEDTKSATALEQVKTVERIFKKYKQKKPNLIKVVSSHAAAMGFSKVYFKRFSTKKSTSESTIIGTVELLSPVIVGLKVKKKSSKKSSKKNSSKKNKSKKNSKKSPANAK